MSGSIRLRMASRHLLSSSASVFGLSSPERDDRHPSLSGMTGTGAGTSSFTRLPSGGGSRVGRAGSGLAAFQERTDIAPSTRVRFLLELCSWHHSRTPAPAALARNDMDRPGGFSPPLRLATAFDGFLSGVIERGNRRSNRNRSRRRWLACLRSR